MVVLIFLQTGCSVFMAAQQPPKKNLGVLKEGTPRNLLLAEFGQPASSELRKGKKVDVFSFTQGYCRGTKVGRAVFHAAADVFTLGLWEIIGTPTEAAFSGRTMAFEVTYDASDKVASVATLQK
jgi:hypothetical protein